MEREKMKKVTESGYIIGKIVERNGRIITMGFGMRANKKVTEELFIIMEAIIKDNSIQDKKKGKGNISIRMAMSMRVVFLKGKDKVGAQ